MYPYHRHIVTSTANHLLLHLLAKLEEEHRQYDREIVAIFFIFFCYFELMALEQIFLQTPKTSTL